MREKASIRKSAHAYAHVQLQAVQTGPKYKKKYKNSKYHRRKIQFSCLKLLFVAKLLFFIIILICFNPMLKCPQHRHVVKSTCKMCHLHTTWLTVPVRTVAMTLSAPFAPEAGLCASHLAEITLTLYYMISNFFNEGMVQLWFVRTGGCLCSLFIGGEGYEITERDWDKKRGVSGDRQRWG